MTGAVGVLRAIWISVAFCALLLVTVPFQILVVSIVPRWQHHLPKFVFAAAARIMGAKITVQGDAPDRGPLLIAANHVSWIDIIAIGARVPCHFIAKSDVASWPVFGPLARLIRTSFIERERRSAVGSFRDEMTERLSCGEILVLFPEGTSTDGRQVLPFKSALFPGHVSVQPLSVSYRDGTGRDGNHYGWFAERELLPHMWHVFKGGRFDVTLTFHPPLKAESEQNRKDQAARCEEIVREGLALAPKGAKETSLIR